MSGNLFGPRANPLGMRNLHGQDATGLEIVVPETPLPMSTASGFLQFVSGLDNKLPNGLQSQVPALTHDDFSLLARPYSEWSPAPFNSTQVRAASAINHFIMTFSGFEDMLNIESLFTGGGFEPPGMIDHELYFNKMRVWGGLMPLSDRRWQEKELDNPENFQKAIDHLEKTDVFLYFNLPSVLSKMRKAYNSAYDHLAHFDTVLAAYHAQQNPGSEPNEPPRGKAAHIWTEYFFSHVAFITARAHAWYQKHAEILHDNLINQMRAAAPGGEREPSLEQEAAMKRLEDMIQYRQKADHSMLIPLTGFKNDLPHWKHLSSPPLVNWSSQDYTRSGHLPLHQNYPQDQMQRQLIHDRRTRHLFTQKFRAEIARPGSLHANGGSWATEAATVPFRIQRQALAETTLELRGPPPEITEELWVTKLGQLLSRRPPSDDDGPSSTPTPPHPITRHWGFTGYRLSYAHASDQWSAFLAAFDAKVLPSLDPGGGVLGAEQVRPHLKITWLDGRDHGIAENDISAARRHYASLHESKSPLVADMIPGVDALLIADEQSINSFLSRPVIPGQDLVDASDLDSVITVAQAKEMDPQEAEEMETEAPGYRGWYGVLGSVLLDDFWPGLFMGLYSRGMRDLWGVAAVHPIMAYAGPYGEYQKGGWGKFANLKVDVFERVMRTG